jgi:hypothetical protein
MRCFTRSANSQVPDTNNWNIENTGFHDPGIIKEVPEAGNGSPDD